MKTASTPRIAFDDVGDGGPALLLLPGWCGPRTVYRPVLAELARHRRALAIDWRGHGGSDPTTADFGYQDLVSDALAVLATAGVDRVIPVGLSHAGWAVLDLRARLGPDRVPGVVFVDWMVLGAPPPFLDALAGLQHPEQWTHVRDHLFAMWSTGITARAITDYIASMRAADRAMWGRAAREIAARFTAEPTPLAVLERNRCPALHLYTQPADPAVLAAQQRYAAAHSWFQVHRLDGVSHFPPLESASGFAARLEQFVAQHGGNGPG